MINGKHDQRHRLAYVPFVVAFAFTGCTGEVGTDRGSAGGSSDDGSPNAGGAGGSRSGTGGGGGGVDAVEECQILPRRFWKLTPSQVENTLRAISGTAPQVAANLNKTLTSVAGFRSVASRLEMTFPHVQDVVREMEQVAQHLAQQPQAIEPCLSKAYDEACVSKAIQSLARKAFRRPPSENEVASYLDYFRQEKSKSTEARAWQDVIAAILLSHNTQFRSEIGTEAPNKPGVAELGVYEKASAIAFMLTDSPPDAALLDAAEKGELNDPAKLKAQVLRLLAKPESGAGMKRFFEENFRADLVLDATKDEKIHPDFTDQIRQDMVEEFRRFVQSILWSGEGKLADFLSAPHTVTNKRLASYYGLSGGASDTEWKKTEAPGQFRSGFLTMGTFAATFGHEVDTDIVKRGRFVREALLCDTLPAPPANVNAFAPAPDGKVLNRDRMIAHFTNPSCAACHELMDPLAFGLEHYDSIGRFRSVDPLSQKPIDASGYLLEEDGTKHTFSNPQELAKVILDTPRAHTCFASTLQMFLTGKSSQEGDTLCGLDAFSEGVKQVGVIEATAQMLSEPQFWQRRLVD